MKQVKKTITLLAPQLLLPVIAMAQIVNPLGTEDVSGLVVTILTFIRRVGSVVAIIAFIWVGFKFIQAQGKPEELKKARGMFMWTVIGVAILLGAELLATLVVGTVKSLGN